MLKKIVIAGFLFSILLLRLVRNEKDDLVTKNSISASWWDFQAVDTMKESRDRSRELLNNPRKLQQITEEQSHQIAQTGATHIGIATPYDDEFAPVLEAWIKAARKYHLKVWFRGNWSGWEEWFEYPKINRDQHLNKSLEFVRKNSHYFEDGDIFSPCPECENGGPGDPRLTGDIQGHREFLIDEHETLQQAFSQINKDVKTNFNSMNGDVARLIMDPATTKALGGLVVVDHYVETPEQLNQDITEFAQRSQGKVILGEFGAPIPDLQGKMSEAEQAAWLEEMLLLLHRNPNLAGTSYWTNIGGSTALWHDSGLAKAGVATLTHFYSPKYLLITITNALNQPIPGTELTGDVKIIQLDEKTWQVLYLSQNDSTIKITAPDFHSQNYSLSQLSSSPAVKLEPFNHNLWYQLKSYFY